MAVDLKMDGGSTNGVGSRFQSFGIIDFGLVTLTFASCNQIREWLRRLERVA
jgi:hypothetical protein